MLHALFWMEHVKVSCLCSIEFLANIFFHIFSVVWVYVISLVQGSVSNGNWFSHWIPGEQILSRKF